MKLVLQSLFQMCFKVSGKWLAKIGRNYKTIFIGLFGTEIEAVQAYNGVAAQFGMRTNPLT